MTKKEEQERKENYQMYKEMRVSYINTKERERDKLDTTLVRISTTFMGFSLAYLGLSKNFDYTFVLGISFIFYILSIWNSIKSYKNSEKLHEEYIGELDTRWEDEKDIYTPIKSKYENKVEKNNSNSIIFLVIGFCFLILFIALQSHSTFKESERNKQIIETENKNEKLKDELKVFIQQELSNNNVKMIEKCKKVIRTDGNKPVNPPKPPKTEK